MKSIFRLLALSLLFMSFQCDDNNHQGITQQMLDAKKQEILQYIASFSCTENSQCNHIAFGAKPCGGPREYLAFSNNVDLQVLQTMVDEYYHMDHARNIQTGAVSDCLLVGPPSTVDCVNTVCTIIN
jgi:hypothetical protein